MQFLQSKKLSCTLKLATYNLKMFNEQAAWSQLSCVTCLAWGAVNIMKGMGCYNLLEPTGVLFLHQHIPLISQHWQCLPHIKDDTPEQVTVINANKTYCYHPIASSILSLYQQSVKLWPSLVFTLSNSSTRWTNIRITSWGCAWCPRFSEWVLEIILRKKKSHWVESKQVLYLGNK